MLGIARNAPRVFRLLMKGNDPVFLIHRHHPEGSCLFETDRQTGDGQLGSGVVVVLQHRGIVHPVDVISRENQRILGAASLQQVEVLVDGVRGAAVPRFSRPHLRGDRRDVLSQFGVVDGPPVTQVLLQRMGLVLREHENAAQSGMKAVAEREIDDAISSAEGHGRLGPLGGQWMQTRTDSARQDDADRLLLHGRPTSITPFIATRRAPSLLRVAQPPPERMPWPVPGQPRP